MSALALTVAVDPLGLSAARAEAANMEERADQFEAAVTALGLDAAAPATPMAGSWGPISEFGSLAPLPADLPVEAEALVVLSEEEPESAAASLGQVTTDPPADPAPVELDLGGIDVVVAPTEAESTPSAVLVRVAGESEAESAGVTGLLLDVTDASEVPLVEDAAVDLTISYAAFAGLVGGDWASRLRFGWLPDCDAEEPCVVQPIETVNDPEAQTVSARVPVEASVIEPQVQTSSVSSGAVMRTGGGGGGSLTVTAGTSGAAGDWAASKLSPSSTWGNSGSTGAFTWQHPFPVPTVPAGPAPQLALSYSSAGSDGRVPSTNNQAGTVGEGFGITEGYVERKYEACSKDEEGSASNVDRISGDLCWGVENATMVFNGSAVELIRDATSGSWHAKSDDGSKIEHITGSSWNGGEANEYWKVTTPDGTQYYFGRGKLTSGGANLNSAWTVPVFGNHPGERCYHSDFNISSCTQVWRWNLEYVVDPSGNSMTYFYDIETNRYTYDVTGNVDGESISYVAGGHLNRIEYGTRAGQETSSSAPAKVTFTYTPRCITDFNDPDSFCNSSQTSTSANHWLDTPVDLICASATPGECENYSPVFFDRTKLSVVTASAFDGSAYRSVNSWTLNHVFAADNSGQSLEFAILPNLVLQSITRTGHGGTSTTSDDITLPPFQFTYAFLPNRVDSPTDGQLALIRPRIAGVRTDSGAQISVNYITECAPENLPGTSETEQSENTRLCYPVKWYPNPGGDGIIDYFHKYVVETIVESGAAPVPAGGGELITGSVDTVTHFAYGGGAGWMEPTSPLIDPEDLTYSDFRGFADVTTTIGLADESSSSRVTYYRGMGGALSAGPPGHIVTVDDLDEHQGKVFAAETLNGSVATSEVVTALGDPVVVAENTDDRTATRLPSSTVYSFSYDAAGALVHRTRETKTYDENAQLSTIDNAGDLTTTQDDTCTTLTYAHESDSALAAAHMLTLVGETEVVAIACSGTPTIPDDLISNVLSTYDDNGHLTRAERLDPVDGVGHILVSEILETDGRGRPLETTDALGSVTTTEYHESAGGLTDTVTTTTPDPDGWGPLSGFVSVTHLNPITGQVSSSVDANGLVTSRTYDALGRILSIRSPERQGTGLPSVEYEYTVDPNGLNVVVTRTIAADGESQQVSAVYYDGLLRPFQVQTIGLDASATDRGRMVAHTYYDTAGRVSSQTGDWWAEGLPDAGPIAPISVPPSLTTYDYDAAGRAVAEVFWVGTASNPANERWRTTTAYDGATTIVIPPMGGTPQAATVDAQGRVVERTNYLRDADEDATADTVGEILALPHQTTTYDFDDRGQLAEIHDVEENVWSYEYDWGGRQVTADDPDSGTTATTYDVLDRVVTRTNGNGDTLAYTYDVLGRVTTLRDDSISGTIRAEWKYDDAVDTDDDPVLGQLSGSTRFVDGNAYTSSVVSYDDAYRPLATTFTLPYLAEYDDALESLSFTTEYTYTADGQVASVQLPAVVSNSGQEVLGSETVTTRYDQASMPSWMGGGFGWGIYVADSQFASDGRPVAADLGNTYGAYLTYAYEDGTERLTGINLTRQGHNDPAVNLAYGYDAAGNITSIRDTPSTTPSLQDNQCFGYDGLRRLEVAWTAGNGDCGVAQGDIDAMDVGGAEPYWAEFEYDTLGNRTAMTEHAVGGSQALSTAYSYGDGEASEQQLTEVAETVGGSTTSTTFEYDDAGNRIGTTSGAETSTHTWDVEGELIADEDYDYVYDASGSRIVRSSDEQITVYLPSGQELTIDGSSVAASRFYSFGGQTIATRTGPGLGNVTSLICDHQGSVIAAVPNTDWGSSSVTRVYTEPFGGVRGGSDAGRPGDRQFLGAPTDAESGMVLLGARYFDPTLGRFVSVDPILDTSNPKHLNAYAYSYNNPVTNADPSGAIPSMLHDGGVSGGSGQKSSPGLYGSIAPPSTSWAALGGCADALCVGSWMGEFTLNYYGGLAESVGEMLWMACAPCLVGDSINQLFGMFSDWDGFWAEQQAKREAFAEGTAAFFADPRGEIVSNVWQPYVDGWVNNPGHALGLAAVDAVTIALPGGAAIKGAVAAAKAAKLAKTADGFLPGLPASAPQPLWLGSTGRIEPANLMEQLALTEVRADPAGVPLPLVMTDKRWPGFEGWIKMQQIVNGVKIHYVRNMITDAVDDFKIKE